MAVAASVQEFLRQANVGYTVLPHVPAFTAKAEAAVVHVPRRDWAKAVVFFADGQPIQAVVPADLEVDMYRLAALAGATTIRLAGEHELRWLYPDCERGAMPPLGPLYNQPVFVDQTLARRESHRIQRRHARRRCRDALRRLCRDRPSDRRPVRSPSAFVIDVRRPDADGLQVCELVDAHWIDSSLERGPSKQPGTSSWLR